MLVKHLLDSLAMAPAMAGLAASRPAPFRLADVGTGPGLPGIPLALAIPGLHVTLVESVGKKARFMREAVRQLGLATATVAESRAEVAPGTGTHDCLTARAFGTLSELIRVGGHLLSPTGRILAMKGQVPHDEIAALPADWRVADLQPLAVPGLGAERHLVVLERTAPDDAA